MFKSAAGGGDFYSHQINTSCRFNYSTGSYPDLVVPHMHVAGATPTEAKKGTISAWVKRSGLTTALGFTGAREGSGFAKFELTSADIIRFYQVSDGSSADVDLRTTAVYRDTSAWYHFFVAFDSTQATDANKVKIYVNGEQVTVFGTETNPPEDQAFFWTTDGGKLIVGSGADSAGDPWPPLSGYLAEFVLIDGLAYAPTDLGERKNGVWIPKDPSGLTFGTNGVYCKFESSGDLGNDSSGNNNDFTVANVNPLGSLGIHTPFFLSPRSVGA